MKFSQIQNIIIIIQRSPYDKTRLFYMGETSYKEDVNLKWSEKESGENLESSNLNKRKDISWGEFGNTPTPKSSIDALKNSIYNEGRNMIRDKDQQTIESSPKHIKFKISFLLRKPYIARYHNIFLSQYFSW